MAENSPTGTATIMAMRVINNVPANSGTAPKAPELPTWSSRMAVCGLHSVPNRNSVNETRRKKRTASNRSESTMPMVIRTATVEHAIRKKRSTRSTRLRARSSGVIRPSRHHSAPAAKPNTATAAKAPPVRLSSAYRLGGAGQRRFDLAPAGAVARKVADIGQDQRARLCRSAAELGRQCVHDQGSDDFGTGGRPQREHGERRQRNPDRQVRAVIARPRMQAAAAGHGDGAPPSQHVTRKREGQQHQCDK